MSQEIATGKLIGRYTDGDVYIKLGYDVMTLSPEAMDELCEFWAEEREKDRKNDQ